MIVFLGQRRPNKRLEILFDAIPLIWEDTRPRILHSSGPARHSRCAIRAFTTSAGCPTPIGPAG